MRRVLGVVLVAIGVFGIVLAILLPTVVLHGSSKTPLNLNITQISSGPAKLLNAKTGKTDDVQLRATRVVRTDSHASDSKNTTVVETLCIVIVQGNTPNCLASSDPRLLSITTDRVTANRRSAESVHVAKYNENVNGKFVKHTGLSYKFPIGTKKKTYQFFQPDLGKAYPAKYEGTKRINDLTTYKFVSPTGVQPFQVLGSLPGSYDDTRTVYVEPQTGTIVDGTEHQIQRLSNGQTALDTTLSFESSAIKFQTNYAQSKIDKLNQAKVTGPLVAGIVGLLALLGGLFLLLRSRRGGDGGVHREADPAPGDGTPQYGPPPAGPPTGEPTLV